MEIFFATCGQTIYLFLLILIGFFLTKWKLLPEGSAKILAKLENNLFIPCLVFSTFSMNFTVEKITATTNDNCLTDILFIAPPFVLGF